MASTFIDLTKFVTQNNDGSLRTAPITIRCSRIRGMIPKHYEDVTGFPFDTTILDLGPKESLEITEGITEIKLLVGRNGK